MAKISVNCPNTEYEMFEIDHNGAFDNTQITIESVSKKDGTLSIEIWNSEIGGKLISLDQDQLKELIEFLNRQVI